MHNWLKEKINNLILLKRETERGKHITFVTCSNEYIHIMYSLNYVGDDCI